MGRPTAAPGRGQRPRYHGGELLTLVPVALGTAVLGFLTSIVNAVMVQKIRPGAGVDSAGTAVVKDAMPQPPFDVTDLTSCLEVLERLVPDRLTGDELAELERVVYACSARIARYRAAGRPTQ